MFVLRLTETTSPAQRDAFLRDIHVLGVRNVVRCTLFRPVDYPHTHGLRCVRISCRSALFTVCKRSSNTRLPPPPRLPTTTWVHRCWTLPALYFDVSHAAVSLAMVLKGADLPFSIARAKHHSVASSGSPYMAKLRESMITAL